MMKMIKQWLCKPHKYDKPRWRIKLGQTRYGYECSKCGKVKWSW